MSDEKKTAAVITKPETKATIRDLVEGDAFRAQVANALPRHLKPDRFIRIACTAITRTPKLMQCDQPSFFNALLTLSQLGIEPDGRRAHLIPFENRKRGVTECQLIIDYKGLVELAMRSGNVAYIHADVICDNDLFEYDRGEIKAHKIDFKKPRGAAYAVYATVRFKDGTEKSEVMTRDECLKIRNASPAWIFAKEKDETVWGKFESEMMKKTAFRRLSKWITLSPEYRDALEADDDQLPELKPVFPEPQKPVPRLFQTTAKIVEQAEAEAREAEAPAAPPEAKAPPQSAKPEPGTPENGESLLMDTIQVIRDRLMEAHVSEGRFVTHLRKSGALKQFGGLDSLPVAQAQEILETMDAVLAEIKDAKKDERAE